MIRARVMIIITVPRLTESSHTVAAVRRGRNIASLVSRSTFNPRAAFCNYTRRRRCGRVLPAAIMLLSSPAAPARRRGE